MNQNREYSAKWQERFEFFEKNGSPKSPEYKAAYKSLPFGKRILVGFNIWAFFFGFIYFLILGLWRKGLTLFAVNVVIILVVSLIIESLGINDNIINAISIVLNALWAITANYAYYRKELKGDQTWNPFTGIF
ncbi:DUF2628 domain-containing protein [Proteus myxofaciens]|uniref:Putative membrane protein n=1 Tax=Proteus myxofaciens ATCC 19692 TaxID=1354337 RepID=A0A198F9X5_9GAMM|nr:DUF2628 domain-containing protein [Proteus myxofaciens]OAT21590.1 putative membrane protein [Proteus myxofaciens ATCC 19692]